MTDSIYLDPREVLLHLQQLGYNNITNEQLKDFIHDLKKLIKYDQKSKTGKENQKSEIYDSTFASKSSKSTVIKEQSMNILKPSNKKDYSTNSFKHSHLGSCSSLSSNTSVSTISSMNYVTGVERPKSFPGSSLRSCKQGQRSKSTENLTSASRPTSSFIRPWRLHPSHAVGQGFTGGPTNRSDPVSLYHKYKEIWKQQKVPGENDHSELRWHIREKMLGQDPNPRPVCETPSLDPVHRRLNR